MICIEMEKLQLIDFSLEDDFLVTDSLEDFRLSVMENKDELNSFKQFVNAKTAAKMLDKKEEKILLPRSNGSGRATNSRDSLAWDSAFFTNAGVLDPDELFTMNRGFEKPEVRKRKSTYSEFMFDTDGFFLESYRDNESDLFEDVQASIRKSNSKINMHSEIHKQKDHISKKLDYMPQPRVKFIPAAKKQSMNKQGSEITEKRTASPSVTQLCEKNGKSKSFSPRPPKISGRANLTSTRSTINVPLTVDNAKIQHKSTTSSTGKGLLSSKKSRLGKPCCSTGSVSSLMASSSLSLNASSDSISYCSPFSRTSSLRSSSNSKIKSDTRNNTLSDSVSSFKTPVRCSLQVQNELENPNSSTFSNHSSYYSTSSTLEESPLESSSVSNINFDHNVNSREKNGDASAELARGSKPSGLKPPSPKIGFFDKEHSSVDYQFHIGSQIASPRISGFTTKKKSRDSTPVVSQARGITAISTANKHSYTKQKQVTDNVTQKQHLKLKKNATPESLLKSRRVGDDGARVEKQLGVRSSWSIEKKRTKEIPENRIENERKRFIRLSTIVPCMVKNKRESTRSSFEEKEKENLKVHEDHVEGLTRYFEGINLKNDALMECSTNAFSKARARMPLADKNCVRK